jgi:two-component system osmolarity sensor histidine kinase EnvZ
MFTSFLTSFIAIVFLKNQIKSIKELNIAAERLGRGDNESFKPSGAKEIRSLGLAFIKMSDRINRQITGRTQMLSAVSHDLRTPLTRMKLQLEMMSKDEAVDDLKSDISDMEKLIDEYLDFSKSGDTRREKAKKVNIKNFLEEIVKYYQKMNKNIIPNIEISKDLEILLKKDTFRRAMRNLVDNSLHYGDEVQISAKIKDETLKIIIDDNGIGISPQQRDNIFKPFYRIDDSRNLDKESEESPGAGLGLSIVMDVVNSHGGRIKADESPKKGLRMTIYLPI